MRVVLALIVLIVVLAGSFMYQAHQHQRAEELRLRQDVEAATARQATLDVAADLVQCHADLADQVVNRLGSCSRPVPEPILATAREMTADLRALELDLRAQVA